MRLRRRHAEPVDDHPDSPHKGDVTTRNIDQWGASCICGWFTEATGCRTCAEADLHHHKAQGDPSIEHAVSLEHAPKDWS